MDYLYAEDPLPIDLRYPLSRSALDCSLDACGVGVVKRVFFSRRPRQDRVLQADYWSTSGSGEESFFEPGTVSISVFAVPAATVRAVQRLMTNDVLGRLCSWLRKADEAPPEWRAQSHFIAFQLAGDSIEVIEH